MTRDTKRAEPYVRVTAPAPSLFAGSLTQRMKKIDSRLLAIARGDIEPDDAPPAVKNTVPPGSLSQEEQLLQIDQNWMDNDAEPEPFAVEPPRSVEVPTVRRG